MIYYYQALPWFSSGACPGTRQQPKYMWLCTTPLLHLCSAHLEIWRCGWKGSREQEVQLQSMSEESFQTDRLSSRVEINNTLHSLAFYGDLERRLDAGSVLTTGRRAAESFYKSPHERRALPGFSLWHYRRIALQTYRIVGMQNAHVYML